MSSDIAWAITRNNSAYLLKKRNCPKPFSTDPMNLANKHSKRHSGVVNKKAISVAPASDNKGKIISILHINALKLFLIYKIFLLI